MITEAILYFITQIIRGAVYLLPDATFPDWIANGQSGLVDYMVKWNFLFPWTAFLGLVGFILLVEGAVLTIYGVNAIIKVVRGSG